MLIFIGSGICNEEDISLRGLNELKNADKVYLDSYTSKTYINLKNLEKVIGKKVELAYRKDLEENWEKIVQEAKEKNVALLVPGDSFIATTHVALRIEAEKSGVKTKVVPGISVYTSVIGRLGLQIYKFGASVTVPVHYTSEKPYDVIRMNKKNGLHTLIFLEHDVEKGEFVDVKSAIKKLFEIEERRSEKVIDPRDIVIGIARLGHVSEKIEACEARKMKEKEFGEPPHIIVYPGSLHFMEREALKLFANLKT